MSKVNIHHTLERISDHWNPCVVAELNGQQVRLVKIQGRDFPFHMHENEEEMFYVVKGQITLEFEQHDSITLEQNEFFVGPERNSAQANSRGRGPPHDVCLGFKHQHGKCEWRLYTRHISTQASIVHNGVHGDDR